MSQSHHPSTDELAELAAGVLPSSNAVALNGHLVACAACRDRRAALLDVSAILAEVGASTPPMPSDVIARLDTVLAGAAAERADAHASAAPSTVVPLATARRRRRPVRWLAGAAAAVAVLSAGVALWHPSSPGRSSASTDTNFGAQGSSGAGKVWNPTSVPPGVVHPGATQAARIPPPPLAAVDVADRARQLVTGTLALIRPATAGCARPAGRGVSTAVLWHGRPAVLSASPATRTAAVLDCETATRSLYRTRF